MTEAPLSPGYPESVVGGELRLPKAPGLVRQFWARHPWLTDSLIAALYFVPTFLATLATVFGSDAPPLWIGVAQLAAVGVAAAAILLLRRRHPWWLIVVTWIACLVVSPLWSTDMLPMLLALYALAVYRSPRAAWLGFAGSVVIATLSMYVAASGHADGIVVPFGADAPASATQFAIALLIATLIGVTVGNRRRYLHALIARAHDLARERDQQAQLAAATERARIAREMHDIVSHGLTVMITLAEGSAATAVHDPDRAADAMRHVADTGRDALDEMRRMLGVLTGSADGAADRAPQPDVAAIPGLVDGFREAGLPARLMTSGPKITEPALQLTTYRVVQEGLTNILRHAREARQVDVMIERLDNVVSITVDDDAEATSSRMSGSGRGLAGLRERVALYGGTLEAGLRPGRGWRVHAELPTEPIDAGERT